MAELKFFDQITPETLKKNGVVSLSDKPNQQTTFGIGGLTAAQLKEHFDKLSKVISSYLNEVTKTLGTDGAKYIAMTSLGDNIQSLEDLAQSFYGGEFAKIVRLYASAGASATTPLQDIINNGAQSIANITDGTTIVGQSKRATEDGEGNVISKTYIKSGDVASHLDLATDLDIDSLFF